MSRVAAVLALLIAAACGPTAEPTAPSSSGGELAATDTGTKRTETSASRQNALVWLCIDGIT